MTVVVTGWICCAAGFAGFCAGAVFADGTLCEFARTEPPSAQSRINTRARDPSRVKPTFAKDCKGMCFVTAAAVSSIVSPCFKRNETRELMLRFEEEGRSA